MIYRIMAVLLSFALGVVISNAQNYQCSSKHIRAESYHHIEPMFESANKEPFQVIGHACGNGFFTAIKSPSGQLLSVENNDYGTVDAAKQAVEQRINKAMTVLEHENVTINGISGERVVIIDEVDVYGSQWAHIITRSDAFTSSINAPTLQLALEFERSRRD